MTTTGQLLTARTPGAVAMVDVRGDVTRTLTSLGLGACRAGDITLVDLEGVDELLLVQHGPDHVQLMPHGGPRIVERLIERLTQAGVKMIAPVSCTDDPIMDAIVDALPSARTKLVVDLLLAQHARWHTFSETWTEADEARSARLDRLLSPPLVVLAGRPNIGKSTLLNRLAGRTRAVTHDAPGTTRDHVGVELDLAGLVVQWVDLPGLRHDAVGPEARAIEHAVPVMAEADVLIAARDASSAWPELQRPADLLIGLRCDLGAITDAQVSCCAMRGDGIDAVVAAVRTLLVTDADLSSQRPWRVRGAMPSA